MQCGAKAGVEKDYESYAIVHKDVKVEKKTATNLAN